MNIYFPPSLRGYKPKRMVFSTWVDHLPFAHDIVEALRPRLLVELGTYNGLSFFGFCQSVQEHDIECLCYAVDTWEGDKHTDHYDDSIFRCAAACAGELSRLHLPAAHAVQPGAAAVR